MTKICSIHSEDIIEYTKLSNATDLLKIILEENNHLSDMTYIKIDEKIRRQIFLESDKQEVKSIKDGS